MKSTRTDEPFDSGGLSAIVFVTGTVEMFLAARRCIDLD